MTREKEERAKIDIFFFGLNMCFVLLGNRSTTRSLISTVMLAKLEAVIQRTRSAVERRVRSWDQPSPSANYFALAFAIFAFDRQLPS